MNATIDISNVVLKTKRLILRPWVESDLNDFFEYASVDGVGQMASFMEFVLGNTNLLNTLNTIETNGLKTLINRALNRLKGVKNNAVNKARTLLENTLKKNY